LYLTFVNFFNAQEGNLKYTTKVQLKYPTKFRFYKMAMRFLKFDCKLGKYDI